MSEWHRYRLDELCEFINGFAFKSTDYVPASVDTIEVFRMGYIKRGGGFKEDDRAVFVPKKYGKKLDKYCLRVGDIAIAMTDMKDRVAILGNTAWIRDENRFVLNQRVGCIRVKQDDLLDPRFLYFYSNWEPHVDYLRSRANSGVQVNLATSAIKDAELYIPPLVEQRAIAHILGTLDDKIELNRKQNETLEAMARALFKGWFVDFEPVRAKMEGRWQRGQSLPGLPAHLYDLFPDKLVESELGEIPQGWFTSSIGEVAVHPRRSMKPDEIEDETPYIALEHMPKRCIALAEWDTANGLESNKYEFKRGEILFGKLRPYFHKVGVAPIDGVCSTDIVVVAPKLPMWFGFVLTHVSSDAFVEYANAGSTGTKMPRTSWAELPDCSAV
jgi:type I restriction enzyme S subunit